MKQDAIGRQAALHKESQDSPAQKTVEESGQAASPSPTPPSTVQATLWQAVKFALFSASAAVIQLVSFEIGSKLLGWPYWLSYGLALVLSVLWNFTFNRRYTFRSDTNVPRAMALVALFYLVFLPASTWAGHLLTEGGANEDLVMVGTMLVNFVTEYLYQRWVVFRGSIDTNDVAQRARSRGKS